MQNGFLNPESPLCIRGARATVPACARLLAGCREAGVPVVFVNRAYRADGSDVEHTRYAVLAQGGKPLTPGSTGPISVENPPEFDRQPEDYEIIKPRYSAFFHTGLDLLLRRLGVDTVLLSGTTTPNCVRSTCYDAISLDYRVVVLSDCCSSNTEEIQEANLLDMGNVGARICESEGFLQELAREQGKEYAKMFGRNDAEALHEQEEAWTANDALEIESKVTDGHILEQTIKRCAYVDMYERIGMKNLGYMLSCMRDEYFYGGFNPDMVMTRSKTLMTGGDCCDFCFNFPKQNS